MSKRVLVKKAAIFVLIACILLIVYRHWNSSSSSSDFGQGKHKVVVERVRYAIYSCSTPSSDDFEQSLKQSIAPKALRGFDYAFYLPLTALSWQRLACRSIVLIIGTEREWTGHAVLSLVYRSLRELKVNVIFVDSPVVNRAFVSQTSRLFVSHMPEWKEIGSDNDLLITTDADIWPLRRQHYVPSGNFDLWLVNSEKAGTFDYHNRTYSMQAITSIIATAATWRQLIPHSPMTSNYSEEILSYFDHFGPGVREQVTVWTDEW